MRTSPCHHFGFKRVNPGPIINFLCEPWGPAWLSRVVNSSERVSESSRRVPKNSFTCNFFFHFTLSSLRLWGMLLSARHRTPVPPLLPLASFRTIVLIQRKGSGKKHSACISRYDFDITMQLQSLTSSRYNFNLPTSPSCTKANSPHTL